MMIAMPVNAKSGDTALNPAFANAQYFAFIDENGRSEVRMIDEKGGRDIARSLIAENVDMVIIPKLELNPFVLLKSYGVKVYFAGEEPLTIAEAVSKYRQGKLIEVTASNFSEVLGSPREAKRVQKTAG